MGSPSEQEYVIEKEPLLSNSNSNARGGFRTLPFIIVNEAFERLASLGLQPNMILYLTREYGMQSAAATNLLFLWSAATGFAPVIGAFLADSYVGRYPMIGFGSLASLLGTALLWLTTIIPCDRFTNSCSSPTGLKFLVLYSSFILMSIGAGGIRSASLAFGLDQLSKRDKDAGLKERYFIWYFASSGVSSLLATSVVVYIQDNMGWKVGFGVPIALMFISTISFFLASSYYVKLKVRKNLLSGLAQVLVASYRNRHLQLPRMDRNDIYHHEKHSMLHMPSEKLRFLNKACVIRDPLQDLTPDGRASDPWNLCTVDQVEELKALLKIIPIWTTGIMLAVNIDQGSFLVLEASSMNRHVTSNFQIPAGSFGTFMVLSIILWIVLYGRVIVPVATRIREQRFHLGAKQKMGVGILSSCIAIASLAVVESVRRKTAIEQGYSEYPETVVNISALWLLPRQILDGLAEACNVIGQNEFFLTELPRSMSSIASTLYGFGLCVASLVASLILNVVDNVTSGGGNISWLSNNINKGHYDYYYWLICGLTLVNFVYFLYCSKAYGPCKGEKTKSLDEGHM